MKNMNVRKLLEKVRKGSVSIEQALEDLRSFPYKDVGIARIDTHRMLRRGFPEVIFGLGKTAEQILKILEGMDMADHPVLITRCSEDTWRAVRGVYPGAQYNREARAVTLGKKMPRRRSAYVAVVTAGTSDIPVAEEAALTAEMMGNRVERIFDVGVAGLHRLFSVRETITGASVIVVAAGMEGALPSVVSGISDAPVIAVPTSIGYGASFGGIAPLLGMLNSCSSGVVVVNIDNGFGAGYAASMILRKRK
jgi:NCAIR mutase (PurE)-related protein